MKQDRVGVLLERVCLDLLGPFPESRNKNKYVLSKVDQFTRWLELNSSQVKIKYEFSKPFPCDC